MTPSSPGGPAEELTTALQGVAGVLLPSHIINRMARLFGGQRLVYVDAPVSRDMYRLTGLVHAFTEDVLVTAELDGVGTQAVEEGNWPGAVAVRAIPRRSLTQMSTVPAPDDGMRNFNSAWAGTDVLRWPNYAELHLRYKHLERVIVLGAPTEATRGQGRSPLDEFVDSLVADLAR